MNQRKLKRILSIVLPIVAVVLISVVLIIVLAGRKSENGISTSVVTKGQLSSKLSSTGVVTKQGIDRAVPLGFFTGDTAFDVSTLFDGDAFDYSKPLPIYKIKWINADYKDGGSFSTADPVDFMRVAKQRVDKELLKAKLQNYYDSFLEDDFDRQGIDYEMPDEMTDKDLDDLLILLYLTYGNFLDENARDSELFRQFCGALVDYQTVTLSTGKISDYVESAVGFSSEVQYTLSEIPAAVGDYLIPTDDLFDLSAAVWLTKFTLTEYDVRSIHARLTAGERVYASVGINALNGRKLVAEISDPTFSGYISGVSTFSLLARVIFPTVSTEEKDGETVTTVDYTYYDDDLTEDVVRDLGVLSSDPVREEELLSGYSLTVSAQKEVIENAMIVATKCIYYDDAKSPYVIVVDSDNKEKRVYINILLSTGTDAAVAPTVDGALKVGDALRYTSDSTLLGSLF